MTKEIRAIIYDQINHHVAMTQKHRDWLAKDIADRVCAIVEPLGTEHLGSQVNAQAADNWLREAGRLGTLNTQLREALERRNREASGLRKLHEDRLAPSVNIELIQSQDAAEALLESAF